ncbi:O-antigen ligase family protein [Nitrococcus mobilis]|uniref:O-antigen ligase-related domain-containing protein n=1 Tax=Nitrococcus mobilis Nb-231 TaxID=314278 RepID=A4BNF1_9GAMM|nr:O-antigen ligase family protein [Nitrococcus mobilis]EAR22750.1 hypothetical protein NB231_09868 [Nitrococcus mobilis Nb-231]
MSMTATTDYRSSIATAPISTRSWLLCAWAVLCTLTLSAVKIPIGFDLRLGQIALAGTFFVLILHDMHREQLHWGALLSVTGCGLMLSALSLFSNYPQVNELTFIVKYVLVYPMAFYTGMRLVSLVRAGRMAELLELVLLFAAVLAVVLFFHPIPALIHERPAYLSYGLKGSFWEQGEFAFFSGLFLLAALALRLEHRHWPQRRWPIALLYFFVIGCALASYNKTIWIALIGACLAAALFYRGRSHISGVARGWALRLALIATVGAVALAAYNEWLPAGEKLVTAAMLQNKWDNERGAALRVAWDLVMQAPLLGHGFGFVEAYFGNYPSEIIGLGSGSAQLFNVYLDIWLSAGVPGLIYALGMLIVVFSGRSLFSVLVVSYLFVFANANPVGQHEYYHLFLGMAFAAGRDPSQPVTAS